MYNIHVEIIAALTLSLQRIATKSHKTQKRT
jgi:hypothetical protein